MNQEDKAVKPENLIIPMTVNLPYIHPDKFAELIGLSARVIEGWIARGYLPTVKVGRYAMVNLVQIDADLNNALSSQGGDK